MDKLLTVSRDDMKHWELLKRIDQETLNKVKFFKPNGDQLYAALDDGRLFAAGVNWSGQLGLGHQQNVEKFEEIRKLRGKSLKDIICGIGHVMVITEDGQVWGWGSNYCGQVGVSDMVSHWAPIRILDKDIVDVKCGNDHTLALRKDNKVVGWGKNGDGQLGTGSTDEQPTPVSPIFPEDIIIDKIAVGPFHSIAVSRDGQAYGWGANKHYQLGLGHKDKVLRPTRIDVHNKSIKSVACSWECTLFLTRDGLMYVTNKNDAALRRVVLETGVEGIACVNYGTTIYNTYSRVTLYLAWTSEELYYWGHSQQVGRISDPIPADLSLLQIILRHSLFQKLPVALYTQQEVKEEEEEEDVNVNELTKNSSPLVHHTCPKFFDSPEFSDIEFVFPEGRSIKAHRLVLSVASEYMSTKLRTTWQSLARVSITSHPYPVFYDYLYYLYTHTLSIDDIVPLLSLAHLAHHYRELDLQQICIRMVSTQLNTDNCCRVFELAIDLRLEEVEEQASKMIIANIKQVRLTDAYKNMKDANAKRLLDKL